MAEQASDAGLRVSTRKAQRWPGADDDVFVIDTLGELMAFYACADVAFVGGSLQEVGGHNLLEPAALGVPAVVGPHNFNFVDIHARLGKAGAVQTVADAQALAPALIALLADPDERRRRGEAGRASLAGERGALARTLALVDSALGQAPDAAM